MEQVEVKPRGIVWRVIAAALTPFAAASVYLIFSRWPSYHFTTFSDYSGLTISVLIGALFVATLPIRFSQRIFWLAIYIPLFAALLFFFTFLFIALVFQDGI
jgi:hypothetical protein